MPNHEKENDDLDTQGMLLVMFNSIQALAIAHPNRSAVRDILDRAGEQQIELLESRDADPELIEAYEFYSKRLLSAISDSNVTIDHDLHLKIVW